ncbi:MAG: hypothetical protein JWN04_5472 [Myxococcaceae bacterium]|nr:hypothetical protein [Myxococcaceae bacterium]
MVVGICRIVLSLPWNDSLKGKRSVVKSILERARNRFHVAAAEVDDLDAHRRATLGFAVVSNDARHAESILDKLVSFVAGATQAEILDQSRLIEHRDLGLTGSEGVRDNPFEWNDEDGDEEED